MVGLRRGDENVQTFDVRGSAFDSSANGEYIVVAGYRALTVVLLGCPSTSWLRLRTNRQVVKQIRLHSTRRNIFSSVSGQDVDIYELAKNCVVQKIVSFPAHSRRISDFNWCPHNENLLVCCADHDTVSFWDLRDTSKPCLELDLVFGASQAKFAPFFSDILLTTHGCDMRLWDLRRTVQPINQFTGHEFRIQCLQWHPQEQNMFATSAIDGFLKLWDLTDQKCVPKILSVGSINAWRMIFSPDGDELASISLPNVSDGSNCVNIFSNGAMDNPQPLKNEFGDVIVDICWQKQLQKSTKYLYTLTKRGRLCRHPVAYELSNEVRDEMATPIAQSAVDEERDRLIAEHADEAAIAAAAAAAAAGSFNPATFDETGTILFGGTDEEDSGSAAATGVTGGLDILKKFSTASRKLSSSLYSGKKFLSNSQLNSAGLTATGTGNRPLKSSIGISYESNVSPQNPALKLTSAAQNTPQSPIISEWSRWITAPNKTGGDLLTELEAIRKPRTEGMYTTEVNFQRAAIGFSYMHWNKCRKINFEMRFHKFFIENGLVFVEVLQKDSPLTPDKATLFLTLLQQESDEQAKIVSKSTILSRVFVQLPKLVESMNVFTPSIDVPNAAQQMPNSSFTTSYEQKIDSASGAGGTVESSTTDTIAVCASSSNSATALKPAAVDPVIYTPSPYDLAVPIPRNCGARFNGSGFLVMFGGRTNYGGGGVTLSRVPRASKLSLSELEKQQQCLPTSVTTEYSALNPFRRRSFQHPNVNLNVSKRSAEHSSIPKSKEGRHRHLPTSSSSEIPRVISSIASNQRSEKPLGDAYFCQPTTRHYDIQQRTVLKEAAANDAKTNDAVASSSSTAHNRNQSRSQQQRRYRRNAQNLSITSATLSNLCFGIPRSLADYCILVPPTPTTQQQLLNMNSTNIFPSKHVIMPSIGMNSSAFADSNSLNSLSDVLAAENSVNNDDDNTSNRHSSINSCSTSPASSSNLFSSSANTVVAMNLHQPTTSSSLSACVQYGKATTFSPMTAAVSSTSTAPAESTVMELPLLSSKPVTGGFVASQPMAISSVATMHRNNSIKSVSKILSSSPSACGICGPSAYGTGGGGLVMKMGGTGTISGSAGSGTTTRSFSLQNVAHSVRHRGNSMTTTAAIGAMNTSGISIGTGDISSLKAGGGGIIVGSVGTTFPTSVGTAANAATAALLIEEHAVMPELSFCSAVFVYDASGLIPISKELASKYKLLGGNALELCRHNLRRVQAQNRTDLIRIWKMLEQCILSSNKENIEHLANRSSSNVMAGSTYSNIHSNVCLGRYLNRTPWSFHPFGRDLINSLLEHYHRSYDIQTTAIITCILGNRRHRSIRHQQEQQRLRRAQFGTARQMGSYATNLAALSSTGMAGGASITTPRYKISNATQNPNGVQISTTTAALSFTAEDAPFGVVFASGGGGGSSGSIHSRSLSASLAPPLLHDVSRTTNDLYCFLPYSPLNAGYAERQTRLNSSSATGSGVLCSAAQNFSNSNEVGEYVNSARSGSFEDDTLPLTISVGEQQHSLSQQQSFVAANSGTITGSSSRKTSNSVGFTAGALSLTGVLRKADLPATYAATTTVASAVTETTDLDNNEQNIVGKKGSSKEQSPQQQNVCQNRSIAKSNNQQLSHHYQQQQVQTWNPMGSSAFNQPNNLDYYYYDFSKEDEFSELFLDPHLVHRFEDIRLQYADMLYRWGMYLKCAEVMKYCITPPTNSMAYAATSATGSAPVDDEVIGLITEVSWCNSCDEPLRHTFKCPNCKRPPLNCAVCEEPCYGTVVTCTACSHGGHLNHIARWFDAQTTCPLNCGCECRV